MRKSLLLALALSGCSPQAPAQAPPSPIVAPDPDQGDDWSAARKKAEIKKTQPAGDISEVSRKLDRIGEQLDYLRRYLGPARRDAAPKP